MKTTNARMNSSNHTLAPAYRYPEPGQNVLGNLCRDQFQCSMLTMVSIDCYAILNEYD